MSDSKNCHLSLKITVPLPMPNSSWSWRKSTFSKIRGGPRRKTEKFWQIEKKIINLYELDNFKKKNFQNRDSKCHFSTDFEQK